METPAVDVEPAAGSPMDRARRGVALIAVSVLAIGAAAAIYVRPSPSSDAASPRAPAPAVANYRVSAVDFVTPTTGWVVADIGGGDSAVVHTTDGGRSWTPQALMRSDGSVPYLKFFDPQVGVLALTGGAPQLDRSIDGGGTWARVALP